MRTGQAKENIAAVFQGLGGVDGMVKWAQKNQTEFYSRVHPGLIPVTLQGKLESIQKGEQASDALERILNGIVAARQESDNSFH
jgi:hypothetical protein